MVDGPNQYSGRVEVYSIHQDYNYEFNHRHYHTYAHQWGTICDYQWTVQDATVICRSLGYYFNKENLQMNETYGSGTGPIWTGYISCSGEEYYIWGCLRRFLGPNNHPLHCNHSMDIGITCSGMYVYSFLY